MAEIEVVDAHFHVFDLSSGKLPYPWPTSAEAPIYRDHLPEHYLEEKPAQIKYSVFVQTINDSPEEIEYVYELSKKYDYIKGIVGGLDITKPNLGDLLDKWQGSGILVGVRQILDLEDPDWLQRDGVLKGLQVLEQRKLTYDLLLRPPLMKYVPALAAKLPNLKMVVDHIAKPYIKDGKIDQWKEEMTQIAQFPNIYCKLSGLVTEADLDNWKTEDFRPYVEHVLSVFGVDRVMFGSDWPVMKLANASFENVFELANQLLANYSPEDKRKLFYTNAIRFYNLKL